MSPMTQPPVTGAFDTDNQPSSWWVQWVQMVFRLLSGTTESGSTAQRPTSSLWVGRPYYDTTIGKPIWVHSINPTVWHLADGTVA